MNMPRTPRSLRGTSRPMNSDHSQITGLVYTLMVTAGILVAPGNVFAAGLAGSHVDWPTLEELFRVLTLQDYNTRVVIIGTTLLGLAAGLVGTFLILRKRALLSDAISHATLPGIAIAFILMTLAFGNGKHLLGLITGAAVFAVLGTSAVQFNAPVSVSKQKT